MSCIDGCLVSRRDRVITAVLLALAGCVTPPQLGVDSGRPAVTWQSEPIGGAPTRDRRSEAEAEKELVADVAAAERSGKNDLGVAQALYNLAILRRQQGNFDDAEDLYRRALAIREHEQGPNHADIAVVLNNLAGLKAAEGQYDAALPLLQRALRIRQAALGDADVLTAQSMSNLALLYAAQGNAAAAEPLYQRAISILEKAVAAEKGAHHAETDGDGLERVLDNYAALLHETGRDARADELEARARVLRSATAAAPADAAH